MRESWDTYYMKLAIAAAGRGTCDRARVGCIIVDKNRLESWTGYNGAISGHDHCDDVGHLLNEEGRCIRTIHAEQNALIKAGLRARGGTAYCTHEPCENCMKLLNQAGIARVVYLHPYPNKWNAYFTDGMVVEQYIPE